MNVQIVFTITDITLTRALCGPYTCGQGNNGVPGFNAFSPVQQRTQRRVQKRWVHSKISEGTHKHFKVLKFITSNSRQHKILSTARVTLQKTEWS